MDAVEWVRMCGCADEIAIGVLYLFLFLLSAADNPDGLFN